MALNSSDSEEEVNNNVENDAEDDGSETASGNIDEEEQSDSSDQDAAETNSGEHAANRSDDTSELVKDNDKSTAAEAVATSDADAGSDENTGDDGVKRMENDAILYTGQIFANCDSLLSAVKEYESSKSLRYPIEHSVTLQEWAEKRKLDKYFSDTFNLKYKNVKFTCEHGSGSLEGAEGRCPAHVWVHQHPAGDALIVTNVNEEHDHATGSSHFTSQEAEDVTAALLRTLLGAHNYSRWIKMKRDNGSKDDSTFATWLMDAAENSNTSPNSRPQVQSSPHHCSTVNKAGSEPAQYNANHDMLNKVVDAPAGEACTYKCFECSFTTQCRLSFLVHRADMHETVRPLLCTNCRCTFITVESYADHVMNAHGKAASSLCHICHCNCHTSQALKRHMNLHVEWEQQCAKTLSEQ